MSIALIVDYSSVEATRLQQHELTRSGRLFSDSAELLLQPGDKESGLLDAVGKTPGVGRTPAC